MGKFITNSFKLRKADESRKNVPFEYYAVFSGKEFNIPVVDVFRKGKIFGSSLDFAKVVFLPVGAKSYENALDMGQKIVTSIKKKIRYGTMSSIEENDDILTRDIRGYLYDIFDVMKMMSSAVKSCGFKMGEDVVFMLDAGAGRLYRKEADMYYFPGESSKRKDKLNTQGNEEETWQNYIEKEVGCQCEGVEYLCLMLGQNYIEKEVGCQCERMLYLCLMLGQGDYIGKKRICIIFRGRVLREKIS